MNRDIWRLSATELAQAIARREVSCVEAARSCLQRIDAVNPRVNAVTQILADRALQAAAAADRAVAQGEPLGPLHGVPVTIKVNVDQEGCATTNGVVAFRDLVATADAPVVANLKRAGAIPIGRTNTPAFSMRWFSDNDLHGRTLNPWDAGITPGGSSGGAAVAVALGMGPIAHGNDQGGSIRYPAYACGVFGLRPSQGRVPAFNRSAPAERPVALQLSAVQGPLARSVADLRLALGAMAARDVRDPWWVPEPLDDAAVQFPTRVALCTRIPGYEADPAVIEALERAARWLEEAGCQVEEAAPPRFREAADLWLDLTVGELMAGTYQAIEDHGDVPIRRVVAAKLHHARKLDLQGYMEALSLRVTLLREWMAFFERHPLLLMPVSWQRPFPVDLDQQGLDAMRRILDAQSPLLATAILGLPGLTVPMGRAGTTPIGVQLVAGRFGELQCLKAAQALEARLGPIAPIEVSAAIDAPAAAAAPAMPN